jgi:hypothetical protein
MNVSKRDYNDCHKLKKYLEKALKKTIIIKDSDDNCFIKVTENDKKQIKNILNKRKFKLSPLFYK